MPIYKICGKKRDGLQKYKIRVNFFSNEGIKKQLTRVAYGLPEARELERRLSNSVKDQKERPVKKITVQQLFEEYAAAKKHEVREATLDKNERNFNLYFQTIIGSRIDRLTPTLIQKWKSTLDDKGLALTTKQKAYSILRAILNYAYKMEYIPSNPLNKVGNFKETLTISSGMKFYTAEEFVRYIGIAKQVAEVHLSKNDNQFEWNYYVFFNIAFYTGLRKGEIYALKWSDITGAYLSVSRSITQKLKGDDRETAPKNRSSIRVLQMPLPLVKILSEHKKRHEQLEHFTSDFRICGGERCIRDSTLDKRNAKYAELSGLRKIRIHDFRHSHVSLLANEQINIQEIARRLGHAKIEETWNTYSHMYPREEEKAVEVLNGIA